MWQHKTISVILPTYNEKRSIRRVIEDFERLGIADEIIVINNNAVSGTSEEVAKTSAIEIQEPIQGYGAAIIRGLKEAKGDFLMVSEPDGTFLAKDLYKFLSYAADFDFIVGTRTTQSLIWEGANMGFFLKWGNYLVGKLTEFIFNTTQLTDAGCTYRLVKRHALRKIQKQFRCLGSAFGLEMIILVIKNNISFIQIPVNYKKRVGESMVTGSRIKAILLGLEMIWMTIRRRLNSE